MPKKPTKYEALVNMGRKAAERERDAKKQHDACMADGRYSDAEEHSYTRRLYRHILVGYSWVAGEIFGVSGSDYYKQIGYTEA